MKAKMPLSNNLKKQVREFHEKMEHETMRRFFKLSCIVLNQEFNFGQKRLTEYINKFSELATEREKDEIFWYHIDKRLKQLHIDFESEDYEEMDE